MRNKKSAAAIAAVIMCAVTALVPMTGSAAEAFSEAENALAFIPVTKYASDAFIPENQPSESDTSTLIIYGVDEGATVRAYHIIEATYNAYGLTGYRQLPAAAAVSEITKNTDAKGIVLYDNPTYENISALTQAIQANTGGIKSELEPLALTWDAAKQAYVTDAAEAGSYLVLVEHETEGYIYNPMWVSNDYTDANAKDSLGADTDAGGNANGSVTAELDKVIQLAGAEAYAKKSQTYLTKDIVNPSTGNTKVDDERVGDTVTFDIKTITPDYSDGFQTSDIRFTITDSQSDGLAVVDAGNIHVYLNEVKDANELTANFTKSVDAARNTWTVDFDSGWVRGNPNQVIIVRYSTVIDEDAVTAVESNPNVARLDYTTVYGEDTYIEDKTRHYTFEFYALKTDADDVPLAGAVFELVQISEGNTYGAGTLATDSVVYTAVSDDKGILNFSGLEEGTYILREVKAPKGYTLNDSTWTVTIKPTYDVTTNTIASYSVNIKEDGASGNGATYTYTVDRLVENDLSDVVTIKESMTKEEAIVSIPDTRLAQLPSVGGIGTLSFSVIGTVVVGGALILTLYAKRKDEKAQEKQPE